MAKPATLDGYADRYTVDCERVLVVLRRRGMLWGLPASERSHALGSKAADKGSGRRRQGWPPTASIDPIYSATS